MQLIRNTTGRKGDWDAMGKAFNTCKTVSTYQDIDNLYLHLMNGFSYMAMTNYPYSSSFLNPMPAWPVNVSCKYFNGPAFDSKDSSEQNLGSLSPREQQVFTAMLKAVNVYYNNDSPNPNCTDFDDTDGTGNLDGYGWNVLACNQLAMPCSNGNNSMFIAQPFDYNAFTLDCQQKFKLSPRYQWVWNYLGGKDI
jgi:lysosomal Pro-X carboxypeptidase